jgi:hypothetical protein
VSENRGGIEADTKASTIENKGLIFVNRTDNPSGTIQVTVLVLNIGEYAIISRARSSGSVDFAGGILNLGGLVHPDFDGNVTDLFGTISTDDKTLVSTINGSTEIDGGSFTVGNTPGTAEKQTVTGSLTQKGGSVKVENASQLIVNGSATIQAVSSLPKCWHFGQAKWVQ